MLPNQNLDLVRLANCVNYHGSELLQVLQVNQNLGESLTCSGQSNNQAFGGENGVDSANELKRRLFQFVTNKLELLFNKDQGAGQSCNPNKSLKSAFPMLDIPMGQKTVVHRREEFNKKLLVGDLLICRAIVLVETGQIFEVLTHHSSDESSNYVLDLGILMLMPKCEIPHDFWPDPESFYRLCIIGAAGYTKPLVSMNWSSVPSEKRSSLKLGRIQANDLPPEILELRYGRSNLSFSDKIRNLDIFRSKTGVQDMAEDLGLSMLSGACSLLNSLSHGGYRPEILIDAIQDAQNEFTSDQSFAEGVSLFDRHEILHAYNCFSRALFVNPRHLKSLLVRGSILACGLKYREALRDLQAALRLDPQHQCCIDLIASVLQIFANEKVDEALENCDSVLDIIPNNQKITHLKQEIRTSRSRLSSRMCPNPSKPSSNGLPLFELANIQSRKEFKLTYDSVLAPCLSVNCSQNKEMAVSNLEERGNQHLQRKTSKDVGLLKRSRSPETSVFNINGFQEVYPGKRRKGIFQPSNAKNFRKLQSNFLKGKKPCPVRYLKGNRLIVKNVQSFKPSHQQRRNNQPICKKEIFKFFDYSTGKGAFNNYHLENFDTHGRSGRFCHDFKRDQRFRESGNIIVTVKNFVKKGHKKPTDFNFKNPNRPKLSQKSSKPAGDTGDSRVEMEIIKRMLENAESFSPVERSHLAIHVFGHKPPKSLLSQNISVHFPDTPADQNYDKADRKFSELPNLEIREFFDVLYREEEEQIITNKVFDIGSTKYQRVAQSFAKQAKEFGLITLKTEGTHEAVSLQLGSPKGLIVYFSPLFTPAENFYDWTTMPKVIIEILEDPHILKIQFDVKNEVQLLSNVFEIGGTIDARCLVRMHPDHDMTEALGIFAACNLLKIPEQETEKEALEISSIEKPLSSRALGHIAKHVRIPLLLAMDLVLRSASRNHWFKLRSLLLSLVELDFDPIHLNNFSNPFILQNDLLHNPKKLGFLKDSSLYFMKVKNYELPPDLAPPSHLDGFADCTAVELSEKLWTLRRIPNLKRADQPLFDGICRFCGCNMSWKPHNMDSCSSKSRCIYPLCKDDQHSIVTCPILHEECFTCGRTGHLPEHHGKYDPDDLEFVQLRFSPLGLFTSISLLTERRNVAYLKFLAPNRGLRCLQRTFLSLDLPYVVRQSPK